MAHQEDTGLRLARFLGRFTAACIIAMLVYYISTIIDPKAVQLLFACYAFVTVLMD